MMTLRVILLLHRWKRHDGRDSVLFTPHPLTGASTDWKTSCEELGGYGPLACLDALYPHDCLCMKARAQSSHIRQGMRLCGSAAKDINLLLRPGCKSLHSEQDVWHCISLEKDRHKHADNV